MAREAPYLGVAEGLRVRVKRGEWGRGARVPSRAQLAEEYGVGRNVAQRAVELLVIEGLLEGRAGSGTFVREPRERGRMLRSQHGEQGQASDWESHSLAMVPAARDIARRLGIAEGDPCVRTNYKFLVDRRPVHVSESWEPMAVTGGTAIELPKMGPLAARGVAERMLSIGIRVNNAVEIPRPARATAAEAALLGVSVGDLLLRIERTFYASDGRPVETANLTVPDVRWEIVYKFPV